MGLISAYEPAESNFIDTSSPSSMNRYPGTTKCMNDGLAPAWQGRRYDTQSSCCKKEWGWNYDSCMGTGATQKWYVDWQIGKCVQDCERGNGESCGGLVTQSWIKKHDSADACCSTHMSYASVQECKFDS